MAHDDIPQDEATPVLQSCPWRGLASLRGRMQHLIRCCGRRCSGTCRSGARLSKSLLPLPSLSVTLIG